MSNLYVPLDAEYANDEKIIAAGPYAELVYVRALALAKRLLSDGRISQHHRATLTLGLTPKQATEAVNRLVTDLTGRGALWAVDGTGWLIVAWAKRNKSADQVHEAREQKAAAGALGNHRKWHTASRPSAKCEHCEREGWTRTLSLIHI